MSDDAIEREGLYAKLMRKVGRPVEAIQPDTGPAVAPSRVGKKALTVWINPEAIQQLKQLAVRERRAQHKLVSEALNDLFKRHGLPPIA